MLDKVVKVIFVIATATAIFGLGYVGSLLSRVDLVKSLGYEKATVEMLNDLSTNEIKKLVEEKKFAVVDGVYYFKGE